MKILKFKTNIDRKEQANAVSLFLDNEQSISKWKIDTDQPEYSLSVSGKDLDPYMIEALVEKAGYKAELIKVIGIDGEDL